MNIKRMARILIVSLLIGVPSGLAAGVIVGKYFYPNKTSDSVETPAPEEFSAFEDKLEPIYTKPSRVYAEEIGLDARLVEVAVESDGSLGTPKEWNVAGWYRKSAKVGASGNLIIVGHYDDNFGRPAAFWGLKNLKVGDTVYVADEFDRVYSYQVTDVFYIDMSDPDRLDVLSNEEESSSLTLITCGGVWVPNQGTYNRRLVVQAEII